MTLDDFLRTLESLIDERESHDADPGEGNFGCEDCRNCNHCRFCIGCDSCEDCTYCEESIDCTSCTQSKRCVGCERVSYCEDCRGCKASRYLTLCVDCKDCVHCLACVGLEGGEFYVLNQKRTRKEYFALLRQVQELMQGRMAVGWRPPGIGLASEVVDAIAAGRDTELSAAPWLEELRGVDDEDPFEPEPDWRDPPDPRDRDPRDHLDHRDYERSARAPRRREIDRELERPREPARDHRDYYADDYDAPRRVRESRRPDRDYQDYAREQDYAATEERPRRRARDEDRPRRRRDPYELDYDADVPRSHEQQPTQPFTGRNRGPLRERAPAPDYADDYAPEWDDRAATREPDWEDSRERTVARPRPSPPERGPEPEDAYEDAPGPNEREPSSPWLDDSASQSRRRAKRGSLRRAGRPTRPPEPEPEPPVRETTGSGSYRTGSAPSRGKSGEGTHTGTGTGLRLGRKPKRR